MRDAFPFRWLLVFVAALLGLILMVVIDTNRTMHAVEHINADRWSGTDMHRWVDELISNNPHMNVPEAEHRD